MGWPAPGANTKRNTGRMVSENSAASSGIAAPGNRAVSGIGNKGVSKACKQWRTQGLRKGPF